ncbi:MAG: metal-dependent transcriptional regulator [Dehalococcoidia bacterium]|nr:metal-dependent transcriptional regulator [Dehalococcoidia bacterium]
MPKQVTNVASDDALTTIYRLSHDEKSEVIAARIAERLGIKPASVAGMLSRLRRDQLVTMDGRKRIHLTKSGFERAETMVRRHRLAECLLVETLGLEWWRAYEEAHLMEHSISDVTEPLIVGVLDSPNVSPFGYPIPGTGQHPHPLATRRVSDLKDGDVTTVQRVYEEDEALLRFFDEEGIRPGAAVKVIQVAPYRGTMTLEIDGREVVLGLEAARLIWVPDR